ncbi:FRAS1-related extracellular matrix protein 1-like [Spea bombifrons]|uniref:FRAS1-related extracellular matrix protein 1-like n=1 Tax=Spea bombifrons TaxID=233779 RepID=UPI00234A4C27|nr:FRAS1-related extracellular matrix protein 1-like [Spea bombifrons]
MASMRTIVMVTVLFHSMGRGSMAAKSLVHVNNVVNVGRGQSVFITDKDLRFDVPLDKDKCKVEVVVNEPISQKVGKLSPQVFDCQFLPEEVKYTHNGSPILDEDHIILRVYRFSELETMVESFVVVVEIVEPLSPIAYLGQYSLEVPEFYGVSSKPVDKNIISFKPNLEKLGSSCVVKTLSSELLLPAFGQVVIEDAKREVRHTSASHSLIPRVRNYRQDKVECVGNKACHVGLKEMKFLKANCADFMQMGIKYQHISPPSPDIDYIPLQVEYRVGENRKQLKVQNIWIPVIIKGAVPNTPPRAAFMPMFILEIDQFILTPLTTATIDAEDDETPKGRLIFQITKPPPAGFITHVDDHTKTITSFTWGDLYNMKIAYQPPNVTHVERQNYEVEFQAVDSFFVSSSPIMVHFSIRTSETNAPKVAWNMGLTLLEGQSRPITWEEFQIVDRDNLQAVRLVIVDGLNHGRLTNKGSKAFVFTVEDIKNGHVRYHHDDSDSTKDYIVFRIYDGRHSIRHKFPINILPKDDSPPFLVTNVGFELVEGGAVLIEKDMLMASDLDSSDDYVLYNITTAPKAGELVKRYSSESTGAPVSSFLQRDLFRGLIYYNHFGGEVFQDSFEFTLSDSHDPPNYSEKQAVIIHITPVKDQLPKEAEGTKRHIYVTETEIVRITKHNLHFTDTESPDSEIVYTVTAPCFSWTPGLPDAGRLISVDSPNSLRKDPSIPVLTSFTQQAVNHMKVVYMPPIEDIGPDPILVQFEFSVSDQHGGRLSNLIFNITVTPVDDKAPKIFTNQIKTEEGASCFITGENLIITDVDTKNEDLRIVLKVPPRHGNVEVHGVVIPEGNIFTLEELNSFKVRYQHDDSESFQDTVVFSVTDGFSTADGELKVQITPVNDKPPELQTGLKSSLECPEGGHVVITAENLYATDSDSDDSGLTYMIARVPTYGMIQRGGVIVERFSQLDITQGLISYIHTAGEIGAHPYVDVVTLIVSDEEPKVKDPCCSERPLPPPVPLHVSLPVYDLNITVTPINNQQPVVNIGDVFIVYEGSSSVIQLKHINASDSDTLSESLMFVVETQPKYGYLENTVPMPGSEKATSEINISSFSFWNISTGHIQYVQNHHKKREPTTDFFMVSVSDGIQRSMAMPFYIIIKPTNDEIPLLHVRNITIIEGGICELGPGMLNAEDLDIPPDTLNFSIIIPPAHGMLLNGAYGKNISSYKQLNPAVLRGDLRIHSFTLDELREGLQIVYMHDDSDSLRDNFTVRLTDGRHTVQDTLHVHVIPVNDEVPRLTRNGGLELEVAENKVISSVALEAEDKDSPRDSIYYIINNVPTFGELKLKVDSAWMTLHPGMNFTQDDVDMNRIWYFHTVILGCRGHDSFRFFVTDGGNKSPPESFFISVQNLEKGDIVLLTRPVTLKQGDRVTLITDVILATDGTGKPGKLQYAVSVPPVHGQIEYINYPGVPISSFSQLDVAAQKVCYVHDNSHEAGKDSFSFTVSNGLVAKDGFMEFIIEHPDQIPPTLLINKGIRLPEGSTVVISSNLLQLTDPDSPVEKLSYTLIEYPRYGQLYLNGRIMQQNHFSQTDVNNMHLSYKHYGGAGQVDRFSFIATDNSNKGFLVDGRMKEDAVVFVIQVEHVDKLPPNILIKETPTTVENTKDGRASILITSRNLKASDPDSEDEDLVYTVLRTPYFGHLENTRTMDYVGISFTQRELNQRVIRYIINPSFGVNSDSFEFKLSDPAGNSIPPVMFEMKWSVIELAEPTYHICEDFGTLAVKLIRTGGSKDPAFVGINVQELTAKSGLDFTHSSASLVQFDPGVSTKFWNVYIKNDGLEENREVFKVLVKSPKNAIVGKTKETTVHIVDPRGGQCRLQESGTGDTMSPDPSRRHGVGGTIQTSRKFSQILLPNRAGQSPRSRLSRLPPTIATDLAPRPPGQHLHLAGKSVLYHGISSMNAPQQNVRRSTVWLVPDASLALTNGDEGFRGFSAALGSQLPLKDEAQQDEMAGRCPSGWTRHGGYCYHHQPQRNATWEDAERACKDAFNGHLTSVNSESEMKWLWKYADKRPFWIGMKSEEDSPGWSWTNGRPVTFNTLKQVEPQLAEPGEGRCVLAWRRKEWVTRRCDSGPKERYICSLPLMKQ